VDSIRRNQTAGFALRALRKDESAILKGVHMPGNLIYYALVLIVIAIVAALLGFGGVASTAMSGAHLLIWVVVVVLIIGVVFALIRRT
jgi:uncharacterized membrane protein YtjA (UPF0391 family)